MCDLVPRMAENNGGWNPEAEPTPENIIAWAWSRRDEFRAYANRMRATIRNDAIRKDVGAMTAEERLTFIKDLLAEEYVLVGGVYVSKAKAADFIAKVKNKNKNNAPQTLEEAIKKSMENENVVKTLREYQAMRELTTFGYQTFLFREKYNHYRNLYYANGDGIIDMRFVDVKHIGAITSIESAIKKSMTQGEGTILIYGGNDAGRFVTKTVINVLLGRSEQSHFVFLELTKKNDRWFIGPDIKNIDGACYSAVRRWPGAHEIKAWLALPPDNITAKNELSRKNPTTGVESNRSNGQKVPAPDPGLVDEAMRRIMPRRNENPGKCQGHDRGRGRGR